ncbi:unnamed protein product, partial [Cuscuta epithymum]
MSGISEEECRGVIIRSTHVQVYKYFLDAEEKKQYKSNKKIKLYRTWSYSLQFQVCIYFLPFLDAEEKKRYGWFWVCRICGKHCHYRYTLPPGYDPKSQMIGSCSLT